MTQATGERAGGWFQAATCSIDELAALVEEPVVLADYPHAAGVERNVVVYDSASLRTATSGLDRRRAVLAELASVFSTGPGIAVFRAAVDSDAIDATSVVFERIIDDQRETGSAAGDHYAEPGANDRIWNALEKLARRDPIAFVEYYGNDIIALASEAWLGPAYQVTSQINVVNPGGEAQNPHRDYHVGFMTDELAERYPAHVHYLSGQLTLQGAVAHVDMPAETGPTTYLPASQKWGPGFLAWRREDLRAYFADHHVQLPLRKGDAVFFNPALFHAAGTNQSASVRRMANLLQVSSAFGRAMESIDRQAMTNAIYPVLLERYGSTDADTDAIDRAIAACAEGYSFPTNLDLDQPIDGLAPESQADLVRRALAGQWPPARLRDELAEWASRRTTS